MLQLSSLRDGLPFGCPVRIGDGDGPRADPATEPTGSDGASHPPQRIVAASPTPAGHRLALPRGARGAPPGSVAPHRGLQGAGAWQVPGLQLEAVVVNAAGCGSNMKEYELQLRNDAQRREAAAAFSRTVKDASEFLVELGLRPLSPRITLWVVYHDPCHLVHGQKVHQQ